MTTILKKQNIFDIAKSRIKSEFTGSTVIIPHVCNNIGLFNGGFAGAVKNEFPIVSTNFELLGRKTKLGYVQYVEVMRDIKYNHRLIFANMIAQNKTISKTNPRPLNYEYLTRCMSDVRNYISNLGADKIEIHCPKFGSGLAGGDWKFIEYLINDIWSRHIVVVYTI